MAWSWVGISTSVETTTTTLTLTLPAGIAQGDLLVAGIAYKGVPAGGVVTIPSGWAKIEEQNSGDADATSGTASGVMFYIVRGASDPALGCTLPVADVGLGRVVAYRGNDATPLGTHTSSTLPSAVSAVSVTGITTPEANCLVVAVTCGGDIFASSAHAATDPATSSGAGTDQTGDPIVGTWQERGDVGTSTGDDVALCLADAIRGTAGATGNITSTLAGGSRAAVLIACFKLAGAAVVLSRRNLTASLGPLLAQ